jgi:YegS/Rv2252/BmrU family lipid kinase
VESGPRGGQRRAPELNEPRRLVLILNPASAGGRALHLLPEVEQELTSLGLQHRVVKTRDMEHAAQAADEAVAAAEVVVAMGGDGIVGALAGAVRERGVLGVLPAGRGNDFARELGIPFDAREACRVLATGEVRELDLGEVNGRPFACIASAGFDSEANRLANEARLVKGNLVYLYAALRALAAWRPTTFTVTLDGEQHSFEGYTVVAANSRYYGGGMRVAPEARTDDGLLDVIFIGRNSKLRFLANLPKVFKGTHVEVDGIQSFRAREADISADRAFDVYADGEPVARLPATVRLVPGAMRVIAPAKQS